MSTTQCLSPIFAYLSSLIISAFVQLNRIKYLHMKEILFFFFIRFLVETTNNDTVELLSVKKKKEIQVFEMTI